MLAKATSLITIAVATSGSLAFMAPTMTFSGLSRQQQQPSGPQYYRRFDDQLTAPTTTATWAAHEAHEAGSERNAISAVAGALNNAAFDEPTVAVLRFDEHIGDNVRPDVVAAAALRLAPSLQVIIGYTQQQKQRPGVTNGASRGVRATLLRTPDSALLRAFHVAGAVASANLQPDFWQQQLLGVSGATDSVSPALLLFPAGAGAAAASSVVSAVRKAFAGAAALGDSAAPRARSFVAVSGPEGEVRTSLRSGGVVGLVVGGGLGAQQLEGAWPAHAWERVAA
ncbi:hypothetical protein JKP88DRAFT_279358 [Tribonema minus]|uniref:Uncharacterized protein n=1 Tax=Tribonema minus TaxID=303371 RepID=A0A836CCH3_9STRA|nr:hypothetical protein JKP88DRAFT_279358 [Tribonema minus]